MGSDDCVTAFACANTAINLKLSTAIIAHSAYPRYIFENYLILVSYHGQKPFTYGYIETWVTPCLLLLNRKRTVHPGRLLWSWKTLRESADHEHQKEATSWDDIRVIEMAEKEWKIKQSNNTEKNKEVDNIWEPGSGRDWLGFDSTENETKVTRFGARKAIPRSNWRKDEPTEVGRDTMKFVNGYRKRSPLRRANVLR